MTDEQMKARIAELEAERDRVRSNYEKACKLVAQMHYETTGSHIGPRLGVVEDVAALRAERDALKVDAERRKTALRIAREGYAGERATGLPVLEEWRERTIAIIDAAMNQPKESGQ